MYESHFSLEIAKPAASDAKMVMQWRNDPTTRAMFYHGSEKVWDKFWPEYKNEYFSDPILNPLFVLRDGVRCAFLRFTRSESSFSGAGLVCDVSLNVAPEFRGNRVGVEALKIASSYLSTLGVAKILAEVKLQNEASLKTFARAGFRKIGESKKLIQDTGENVSIVRFEYETVSSLFSDKVYIIAEAGSNWRMGTVARDMAMAKALIEVAVESGSDAIKFQTYRPETVYVSNAGTSDYLANAGIKTDISEIFKDLSMPYEMIGELSEYCKKFPIDFMSTPFSTADFEAVDPFVVVHKIASYEMSHIRLIQLAARSGKPVIISTGSASALDIEWAVNEFRDSGGTKLCLMQCTAKYPAPYPSMNLRVIPWIRSRFNIVPGFSDHSRHHLHAPLAAVAMGARVIEKHFTIDNRLPGPDHSFAILPNELKEMVKGIRAVEESLGTGKKVILEEERELSLFARRGIQSLIPISKGDVFRENGNLAILRPGKQRLGIHSKYIESIEGKIALRDIQAGDGIQQGDW